MTYIILPSELTEETLQPHGSSLQVLTDALPPVVVRFAILVSLFLGRIEVARCSHTTQPRARYQRVP